MSAQIVFDDGVSPTTGSIERANAFLGTAFTASNFDNTGILGWQWTILYKPPGSATGLTSSTSATPQFTPDVEGTYLLRLQVFSDAGRTQLVDSDEQFVSVAFAAPYAWHIPAVGETGQRGAAGWGNPIETILRALRAAILAVSGGIDQLTGDVTAGPGTGSQAATVAAVQGQPWDVAAPTIGYVPTWDGSKWTPYVTATTGISELTGDVTAGPATGSTAATVTKVQGRAWDAAAPSPGDVPTWDGMKWTPAAPGGGGVTDLQGAYDGSSPATIAQTLEGGILMTQGTASPVHAYVLRLQANIASTPFNALEIQVNPATPGTGRGIEISMGANASGNGVYVGHAGSGAAFYAAASLDGEGLYIAHTGSGDGAIIDTSGGTGDGLSVLVSAGKNPIQTSIAGVNAFTIDGAGALVDIGTPAVPLDIYGYGTVLLGDAAAFSTLLSFSGYTTVVAEPTGVAGLGRLLWRDGTNTAASTYADLAHIAGTGAETLLTKRGEVYAQRTLREYPIANSVTLSDGDVVYVTSASRVDKANADDISTARAIGVVVVGGTGDAGGTVYALVVTSGVVLGLSGLTAGGAVYLASGTAGGYTSTIPSAAASYTTRLGVALSSSSVVIEVEAPRTPEFVRVATNTEVTGTSEVSLGMVHLTAGAIIGAGSSAMVGATSGVSDTAALRIRRFTGGAQVAIFSATGTPADTAITASYTVAASDWYEFTLAAGGAAQVALCQGVHLHVYNEAL